MTPSDTTVHRTEEETVILEMAKEILEGTKFQPGSLGAAVMEGVRVSLLEERMMFPSLEDLRAAGIWTDEREESAPLVFEIPTGFRVDTIDDGPRERSPKGKLLCAWTSCKMSWWEENKYLKSHEDQTHFVCDGCLQSYTKPHRHRCPKRDSNG